MNRILKTTALAAGLMCGVFATQAQAQVFIEAGVFLLDPLAVGLGVTAFAALWIAGLVAAALATRHWAGEGAPHNWRVDVPGGTLAVRMFPTEEGEHVALSGPAELVYTGTVELV